MNSRPLLNGLSCHCASNSPADTSQTGGTAFESSRPQFTPSSGNICFQHLEATAAESTSEMLLHDNNYPDAGLRDINKLLTFSWVNPVSNKNTSKRAGALGLPCHEVTWEWSIPRRDLSGAQIWSTAFLLTGQLFFGISDNQIQAGETYFRGEKEWRAM